MKEEDIVKLKFGDKITYSYIHSLNRKSSLRRFKEAIFIKKEGDIIYIVCEGNKSITKTDMKHIWGE